MQYITTVHLNAVSEEREQEFTNWYNYVHFRDVMNLDGHIAAQRFWRDKYQPKNYDETFKFFTLYELTSKALSTKGHQASTMTWRMMVTPAMDLSNYKESYWDEVHSSVPYASYAEFGDENHLMVALMCPKEGSDVQVADVFTEEVICQLGTMKGAYAANLFRYADDQMPKRTAAPEKFTHELIIQWEDTREGTASWEELIAQIPGIDQIEMAVTNYVSLHPRLKRCDSVKDEKDRALSALYHIICNMPGYHVEVPGMDMDFTDIITPAIKAKL